MAEAEWAALGRVEQEHLAAAEASARWNREVVDKVGSERARAIHSLSFQSGSLEHTAHLSAVRDDAEACYRLACEVRDRLRGAAQTRAHRETVP
jgi:hypothetical protein